MDPKVFNPGAIGLVNYRGHFSRPITGTVAVRGRGRQAGYNRPRVPFRPPDVYDYFPNRYIAHDIAQYMYRPTKSKPKKQYKPNKPRKCCKYIRGKKYCSPRYCRKKRVKKIKYWY